MDKEEFIEILKQKEYEFSTFKEYILEFLEYDDESYFYNQTNEKLYQIAPLGFIQEILWQK